MFNVAELGESRTTSATRPSSTYEEQRGHIVRLAKVEELSLLLNGKAHVLSKLPTGIAAGSVTDCRPLFQRQQHGGEALVGGEAGRVETSKR